MRLEILIALRHGPQDGSHLAAYLELGAPLVSRYLGTLEQAGWVRHRENGHAHIFSLSDRVRAEPLDGGVRLTLNHGQPSVLVLILSGEDLDELDRPWSEVQRRGVTATPSYLLRGRA